MGEGEGWWAKRFSQRQAKEARNKKRRRRISTIGLNDGIFIVLRFSVATSARLRKPECIFRFYVHGGISDNPPGFFYLHVEQVVFIFFSFLLFGCKQWGPHPRKSTAHSEGRRGGGFLLSRVLFLIILLVVVYIFCCLQTFNQNHPPSPLLIPHLLVWCGFITSCSISLFAVK
jgi:hypothetical protein